MNTTNQTPKTDVLLKEEEFGRPISEKLSNYLRAYTDKDDRADVAATTGVGTSTIRNVIFRSNSLTEDNSKAIIEMVRIAIENCESRMKNAREAVKDLKSSLEIG